MNRTLGILITYVIISLYIGYFANDRLYYIGDQICECLLVTALVINLPVRTFTRHFAEAILVLCVFELIDELLNRNTEVFWNDYVGVILAAIYLLWRTLQKK